MSKRRWYKVALGILGLAAVVLIAVQRNSGRPDEPLYEAKFALVAPKKWSKLAQGIAAADREFGTLTKYILYTQDEDSGQADALRYALLSGVDGIITGGMELDPDTEEVILQAQADGVPVVFVDSDLEGSARNCYVGSDNCEVGRMAGAFLAQQTGGQANICVVISYETNASQQERIHGLQDAISGYPGMAISMLVEGRSSALFIEKELPKALQSNPDINCIVCAEGAATHYCGRILIENGIQTENYCMIGMEYYSDLAELVEQGVYAALIWQNQYDMGYQAVRYLKDTADGTPREESVLYTELALVTAENFAQYTSSAQREEIQWNVF